MVSLTVWVCNETEYCPHSFLWTTSFYENMNPLFKFFYKFYKNGKLTTQKLWRWTSSSLKTWNNKNHRNIRSIDTINHFSHGDIKTCRKLKQCKLLESRNDKNWWFWGSLNSSFTLEIWIHKSRNVWFKWDSSSTF